MILARLPEIGYYLTKSLNFFIMETASTWS